MRHKSDEAYDLTAKLAENAEKTSGPRRKNILCGLSGKKIGNRSPDYGPTSKE
jgi:hypothetical protein